MIKVITLVPMLLMLSLMLVSCSCRLETTITGGYGYEVGDIVLIDTQKEPELGDIVQYNWVTNKSNCMGTEPSLYLAKIIGLPGDDVSFQQSSYEANGYEGSLERCNWGANGEIQIIWGNEKFDNIAGMKLKVPNGEYLV